FAFLPACLFLPRPRVAWTNLAAYGMLIGVGQFGVLYIAMKGSISPGLASLVIQTQVFFTIFLAFLLFHERPTGWQVGGAAIAFAGIGVIALDRLEGAALWPLILTILAAGCWGLGNMASKQAGRVDMLAFVAWSALVPPIPLFLASLVFDGPGAIPAALEHITWRGIGSIAFMSYVATLFGFGAWAWLLSRYPASQVSPYGLLVPVAGIASAALFLGETVSGIEVVGSVLVFAGLLVNIFGPRLKARKPA
ncbi:MAG TPA: EamA family transporter, partial [Devosia sp.]